MCWNALKTELCLPRRQVIILHDVEVEERRSEAHCQVHGGHLVLLNRGSDII